jgi:predicted nucleotidyltransferase
MQGEAMPEPRRDPSSIISPGTQVVLRYAKRVPGTATEKPAGSVARVVESPSSNRFAYVLRFADGAVLRAKFAELAVRRREVEDEMEEGGGSLVTPGEDLRPFVVYRCTVGSRAFGLASEGSDEDIRGVYLPPADRNWSLWKPPEQWESSGGGLDEVYWEIEKFLLLALKANPSILEILWTPTVLHADELGTELRGLRDAFLSKHIYATYSGYVLSQFRRMRNSVEKKGTFKAKHAMHLVRLLLSGIHALRTGEIRVDVSEHREELLAIKRGERTFEEVRARALDLDREFQEAFARTALPDRPDYARANAFLIRARTKMADEARKLDQC